jgi:hypothetical protein
MGKVALVTGASGIQGESACRGAKVILRCRLKWMVISVLLEYKSFGGFGPRREYFARVSESAPCVVHRPQCCEETRGFK